MRTYLDKSGSGSMKTTLDVRLEDAKKDKITTAKELDQSFCKTVVENRRPKQQIRSMLPVVCCVLRQPKHKTQNKTKQVDHWARGSIYTCRFKTSRETIKIYRKWCKPPWLRTQFLLQSLFLRSYDSVPCQDVYVWSSPLTIENVRKPYWRGRFRIPHAGKFKCLTSPSCCEGICFGHHWSKANRAAEQQEPGCRPCSRNLQLLPKLLTPTVSTVVATVIQSGFQ